MLHHRNTNKRYWVKIKGKRKIQSLHVISIKAKEKLFSCLFCLLLFTVFLPPPPSISPPRRPLRFAFLSSLKLVQIFVRIEKLSIVQLKFGLNCYLEEKFSHQVYGDWFSIGWVGFSDATHERILKFCRFPARSLRTFHEFLKADTRIKLQNLRTESHQSSQTETSETSGRKSEFCLTCNPFATIALGRSTVKRRIFHCNLLGRSYTIKRKKALFYCILCLMVAGARGEKKWK